MTENSVFTVEEIAELAATQQIRKTLIDSLTEDGVPDKGPQQVLLLGLLDGSDRSAFTRAKFRADKKRDEVNQNTIRMVGEAIRSISAKTYRPPATATERTLPPELEQHTFVPGELEIGIEPIPLEQVIEG